MPNTGLEGPFELTAEMIDAVVKLIKPGTYALGYINDDNAFVVEYAGRSDDNLNKRLHDWIGSYRNFKALYSNSMSDAFRKECDIYHDFSGLDNEIHPRRPDGTTLSCPRCGRY